MKSDICMFIFSACFLSSNVLVFQRNIAGESKKHLKSFVNILLTTINFCAKKNASVNVLYNAIIDVRHHHEIIFF